MNRQSKLKKYFVSMACKVFVNSEIEVEAKNKHEAFKKALDAHMDGKTEYSEPDWVNTVEDDFDEKHPFAFGKGVYMEEIEK